MATTEAPCSSIRTSVPRLLLPDTPDNKFDLAESPVWCEDSQRLHWVSQEGNTGVHTFSVVTGQHSSVKTSALTPAVVLTTQENTVVACLEQEIVAINLDTEQVRTLLRAGRLELAEALFAAQDAKRGLNSILATGSRDCQGTGLTGMLHRCLALQRLPRHTNRTDYLRQDEPGTSISWSLKLPNRTDVVVWS